jgi:NADPH2:quinone reductase
MDTIILDQLGDSSHFQLKKLPDPMPKAGEVRIHIKSCGFNPVDCKIRQGAYAPVLPIILGADCSGVIDAVGEGVEHLKIGDEVMAFVFGQGSNGTYAEKVCISEPFVIKKPKQFSFDQAAAFPLAALTAYRSVHAPGMTIGGHSIFISGGAGGVGHLAIQIAQQLHPKRIFTTAGSKETSDFLISKLNIHPQDIILYKGRSVEEMKQELFEKNEAQGVHAALDFVGGQMKHLCFEIAGLQGHVTTVIGKKDMPVDIWDRYPNDPFSRSLSLHLIMVGTESMYGPASSWNIYHKQLSKLAEWAEQGKVVPIFKSLGSMSVETVREAHRLLEGGKVKGKLVANF